MSQENMQIIRRGLDAFKLYPLPDETGRMTRDGLEVEQDFSHSFRLRDGLIVEWRMHDSHRQALEAVGLSE